MKYEEAIPLMREGKKIKMVGYEWYYYIYNGILYLKSTSGNSTFANAAIPADAIFREWEVYE
jgi:hypothetical protein